MSLARRAIRGGGTALLLVALAACARHYGGPPPGADAAPPAADAAVPHGFHVEAALRYTPEGWPQPLLADLYLPEGTPPPGGWPAVIALHGGAWKSGDRARSAGIAKRAAARGYAVLAADYRLLPAWHYPAPVEDVQQAVRWLRANAARWSVDPQRIALWGYSAGAHLALLVAGLSAGDRLYAEDARVVAAVGGGSPTDLRDVRRGSLVRNFLGEPWREASPLYAEASPISHVGAGDPPVFLYHGSWDALVPASQATRYRAALEAAQVPCELYLITGLGHSLTAKFSDGASQAALDFLDRQLAAPER